MPRFKTKAEFDARMNMAGKIINIASAYGGNLHACLMGELGRFVFPRASKARSFVIDVKAKFPVKTRFLTETVVVVS